MAETEVDSSREENPQLELEGGTYEIIRNRLAGHGKELRARLGRLNEVRKQVFGSIEAELVDTQRVTTQHNCVPRDMVAVGNRFLFGYNVQLGLKTETELSDVFAAYEFKNGTFHQQPLDLIADERFAKDFQDLYRYYKKAVFAKFFVRGPNLYMVFRVGQSVTDIKTFKWRLEEESLTYLDNRQDHEVRYPSQHEFEWVRTHRDQHQSGQHPHVSIRDRVFVETVGGDLTIKVENNTQSGEGIYTEPVDDPDQTLDDAEIYYALVGNVILLKIRPFQEERYRYFIFNEKLQRAVRMDSIETACVLLPDDHGLIFSNGYYLQTGDYKTFDVGAEGLLFERRLAAPNGEDFLYIFYQRYSGDFVLLPYNLIGQRLDTPILCNGFTLFGGGELLLFKTQQEPQKHHSIQIWRTPHLDEGRAAPAANTDSYLYKVGNRDVVRAMAECHEVLGLIGRDEAYATLYVDLAKKAGDIADSYHWIGAAEALNLGEVLREIRDAAAAAVEEFDKVVRVKKSTAEETGRVERRAEEILSAVVHKRFEAIDEFVSSLADLRAVRGEIIALRDLRYVAEPLVESLESRVFEEAERLAGRCVEFLLRADALQPYQQRVGEARSAIESLEKVTEARQAEEGIAASAGELEMLIEIVSNLKIEDSTQRTAILDSISAIFTGVNQARAALKKKTHELLAVEGVAEFNSQLRLLNQSVVNYLDVCDSPDKCEEYLTKVMVLIEELEGRFAEFDEFVIQLSEKREEIYNAFESRRVALVEARNKRASGLMSAADRILKGIKGRVERMETIAEIHGYFASDLMIDKVRDIVGQLEELEDSVKVDEIQSRLKSTREDAVRQLKDRQELFVGGDNVIKLGQHQFAVNVQALDLTTVVKDGDIQLHLTGTDFFESAEDPELLTTREAWDQEVISENREVYRAEYLAARFLEFLGGGAAGAVPEVPEGPELERELQRFMGPRYAEGYVKGVHDHDAAILVGALCELGAQVGLLRFHASARALAQLFWRQLADKKQRTALASKLRGAGAAGRLFPGAPLQREYLAELTALIAEFATGSRLFAEDLVEQAAEYLYFELLDGGDFAISQPGARLLKAFHAHLEQSQFQAAFQQAVKALKRDEVALFRLARFWIRAFLAEREQEGEADYADEVAVLSLLDSLPEAAVIDAPLDRTLKGFAGTHRLVEGGLYHLHYGNFTRRLSRFAREVVPRFELYTQRKKQLVKERRESMKLEEFQPRVLTSFVRNRLLDMVYLPLIGDNLAKQIGVAGEGKRTDRMGLLLLISPPGYGKTTLMEYVANRLGIIFMKINGPAIGHQVTALDPDEAPNAAAREEMKKLGLALEMGDNVMIYLDDIQHLNPEFLQKFISLCDAQRKIEGVYRGRTRTYDFRGRKVAVVMAGNPYTESGEKFRIPDMLANRADIYNLGEIIGSSVDAFEMSYLENAVTSNPVLNRLGSASQKDVQAVIKMAADGVREGVELEGRYSLEELNEMIATMEKMLRVRDVVLKVNREYIRSAAQSDAYRTEPPFLLQGSYRNMNRIAEKVYPVLNDQELETLIVSSYEQDAQTLTTGTESNLLKFKELLGILSEDEARRWEDIKKTFRQSVELLGVGGDDKFGQVILQLGKFREGLDRIRGAVQAGMERSLAARAAETEAEAERERVAEAREAPPDSPRNEELIGPLQLLGERLESLRSALAEGLQRVTEATRETPAAAALALPTAPTPAAPPEPAAGAPEPDAEVVPFRQAGEQTITVVNKIPHSILSVVRNQFQLMQTWMEPIYEATREQGEGIAELRDMLSACLRDYQALLKKLEKAERRRGN